MCVKFNFHASLFDDAVLVSTFLLPFPGSAGVVAGSEAFEMWVGGTLFQKLGHR